MSGGGVTGCPHLLRGQVSAHQVIIPGKRVSGLHELEALTRHLFAPATSLEFSGNLRDPSGSIAC